MSIARAVAGQGFDSGFTLPPEPPADDVFDELLFVADHHRLTGALAEGIANGELILTEDQFARVSAAHRRWMRHALLCERVLMNVSQSFERAGIDFRILKGVPLAHLVYGDPAWRVFADVDILVPSDSFDDAVRVAKHDLAGIQAIPELRAGFDHEFGKEALVTIGEVQLDIHRTFVTGPFGHTIKLDDLFTVTNEVQIGDRSHLALSDVDQFIHACYNLALGDRPVRLCSLRDLLMIQGHLQLPTRLICERAQQWGATVVLRDAAQLAIEQLQLEPNEQLRELASLPVTRQQRLLVRSYYSRARSYTRPLASLAVLPGVRAKARYARALVAPSSDYLASRDWTMRSHIRRAASRVIGRG